MPQEEKKNASLSAFFGSTLGTLGSYAYNSNNFPKMLAVHTLGFVEVGIQILTPIWAIDWLKKNCLDDVGSENEASLAIGLTGVALGMVLPRIRNLLMDSVKRNIQEQITINMVKKVYDGELDEAMGQPTGKPAAIISKNYGSIQSVIPIIATDLLPAMIETFGISAVLSYQFGRVGTVPVMVFLPYLFGAIAGEIGAILLKIGNQSTMVDGFGTLLSVINRYTVAHQFGNMDIEIKKLETALDKLGSSFKKVRFVEEGTASALAIISKLGMIGAVASVYSNPPVADFWRKEFLLFAYYILRSTRLAESLPAQINSIFTGLIDTHLIVDFFKKHTTVPDPENPINLNLNRAPKIEFRNVSFSYGDGKRGISDISFTIEPGKKIAVMGSTGSGKSTILRLLQRFYDYEGQILLNNVDIKDVKKSELRSYLSVVAQDAGLTNDTVYNNIRYGDRTATDDDIHNAAKFSHLKLDKERFSDLIQEDGGNFSGGEKQRINMARALLKRKSYIFLLDEPTSALDQTTAKLVHDTLDEVTQDVTTILVTHDPNAVIHVDCILYISEGKIIETGTFNELMELQGEFHKQFNIQCEKLGISPTDIRPVAQKKHSSSSEFSIWRENRRKEEQIDIGESRTKKIN